MFSFFRKPSEVTDEQAMRQMMLLLDEWKAPDPSPWFDARMAARFREEQLRAPNGIFARLRDQWLFNRQATMKPMMVGAMALVVMAGGGGYWQVTHLHRSQPVTVSTTVHDLQVLDNDDKTLQQIDQLLDDDDDATPES